MPLLVAKIRQLTRVEVARHLVQHIAVEWLFLRVQRSIAPQDDEWLVPAEASIGLQSLNGCNQP